MTNLLIGCSIPNFLDVVRHRFLLHLPSDAAGNLISFADGEVVAGESALTGIMVSKGNHPQMVLFQVNGHITFSRHFME